MNETNAELITVREAVGVFHSWAKLQAAVDDLLKSGFARSELSLLATDKARDEKLRHSYRDVAELEDDASVPRRPFTDRDEIVEGKAAAMGAIGYLGAAAALGVIIASGGTLAMAILGAVAGGGGGLLVGSRFARAIGRDHATAIDSQLRKGGVLLWVMTRNEDHERIAIRTLKLHDAEDVHIHEIAESSAPESDPLADAQPDPFLSGART